MANFAFISIFLFTLLSRGLTLSINDLWGFGSLRQAKPEEPRVVEVIRWRQPVCLTSGPGVLPCTINPESSKDRVDKHYSKKTIRDDLLKELSKDDSTSDLSSLESKEGSDYLAEISSVVSSNPKLFSPEVVKSARLEDMGPSTLEDPVSVSEGIRGKRYLELAPQLVRSSSGRREIVYVTKVVDSPVLATLVATTCLPDIGIPLCDEMNNSHHGYGNSQSTTIATSTGSPIYSSNPPSYNYNYGQQQNAAQPIPTSGNKQPHNNNGQQQQIDSHQNPSPVGYQPAGMNPPVWNYNNGQQQQQHIDPHQNPSPVGYQPAGINPPAWNYNNGQQQQQQQQIDPHQNPSPVGYQPAGINPPAWNYNNGQQPQQPQQQPWANQRPPSIGYPPSGNQNNGQQNPGTLPIPGSYPNNNNGQQQFVPQQQQPITPNPLFPQNNPILFNPVINLPGIQKPEVKPVIIYEPTPPPGIFDGINSFFNNSGNWFNVFNRPGENSPQPGNDGTNNGGGLPGLPQLPQIPSFQDIMYRPENDISDTPNILGAFNMTNSQPGAGPATQSPGIFGGIFPSPTGPQDPYSSTTTTPSLIDNIFRPTNRPLVMDGPNNRPMIIEKPVYVAELPILPSIFDILQPQNGPALVNPEKKPHVIKEPVYVLQRPGQTPLIGGFVPNLNIFGGSSTTQVPRINDYANTKSTDPLAKEKEEASEPDVGTSSAGYVYSSINSQESIITTVGNDLEENDLLDGSLTEIVNAEGGGDEDGFVPEENLLNAHSVNEDTAFLGLKNIDDFDHVDEKIENEA